MGQINRLLLEGEIPVNCYILSHQGDCVIIDPGYEKQRIRNFVASLGYRVQAILLTHAHIDHIEALDCFDVPVYLHQLEFPILTDLAKNGFDFFDKKPQYHLDRLKIVLIDEHTKIPLGDEFISVIHTPGHTVGSVCYRFGQDLFSGDTLFEGSVGKWDRPTGDQERLKRTIVTLIDGEQKTVRVHPAHGSSTTIAIEKQYNPFYLNWSRELFQIN